MRPGLAGLAAGLTLLVATAAAPMAQRPSGDVPGNQRAPKGGVITGIVRAADTGRPLRGVDVRLTGADFTTALEIGIRGAFTDATGRYEFSGLPEGQYTLVASKVRYMAMTYGETRAGDQRKPVRVGTGQRVENVDFTLPAGAVIVVRVSDRFGDVAVGYPVSLYQATGAGQRALAQVPGSRFSSTTDDRGEIRLSGLAPGEYFVSASSGPFPGPPPSVAPRDHEVETFYPGTDSKADAQPVTVGIGDEVVVAFNMVTRIVNSENTR